MTAISNCAQRIAITGASGFIGQALCAALLARGDGVYALGRNTHHTAKVLHTALEQRLPEHCVVADYQQLATLDPTAVINLAGENIAAARWTARRKQTLLASRLDTSAQISQAIAQHWPAVKTVISASAIGYYGDAGDTTLAESAPPGSDFAADLCQRWEAAIPEFAGRRSIITRFGVVLGNGGALAKMRLPFALGLGSQFGDGQHWQAYIHRDDAVAALLYLLDSETLTGTFNLVCPEPVRNRDFTRNLARSLHRPAFLRLPRFAADLAFGEMADVLYASQRVIPQALTDSGFKFHYPTAAESLQAALAKA